MISPRRPCDASRRSERPAAVNTLFILPLEVQTQIIELACASSHLTSIDSKTTTAVMFLSKHYHALTAPLLYRNVKVTRPSMLVELVRALEAKPELGRLIRNLHLGSDGQVTDPMWPLLTGRETGQVIWTSLSDEQLLPQWCCPRRGWNVNPPRPSNVPDHRDEAVLKAVRSAQFSLGVDLWHPKHDDRRRYIGSLPWLVGVIEVQGALDLYLMEMRRLEDGAGHAVPQHDGVPFARTGPPHAGPRLTYPTCEIGNAFRDYSGRGYFSLRYKTVVEHLARRGALTDRFDHPLVMARAGIQVLDFDEEGEASPSLQVYLQNRMLSAGDISVSQRSNWRGLAARRWIDQGQDEDEDDPRPRCILAAHTNAYARATGGGSLDLARRLLDLAPQVQNLFLTGLFQQLIRDGSAVKRLPSSLRGLYLGPLSLCHANCLAPSADLGLGNLERLYMRGACFAERKTAAIAAYSNSLKEVLWDFSDCSDPFEHIFAAIQPLINSEFVASSSRKRSASHLQEDSKGADSSDDCPARDSNPRTTTIRIKSFHEERLRAKLTEAGHGVTRSGYQLHLQPVDVNMLGPGKWNEAKTGVSNAYEHLDEQWQRCAAGSGEGW